MDYAGVNGLPYRLKKLRRKLGYTQEQVAKFLPVLRSTYAYYESGKTMPDIPTIVVIAKIFGCSLEYLLTGTEREPGLLTIPALLPHTETSITLPDYEQRLLEAYRHLSFSEKRVLLMQLEKRALEAISQPK